MELHVYDNEGKLRLKFKSLFSLKDARASNVRRLVRQTQEILKLFNKVSQQNTVDNVEERSTNSHS